MTDAVESGRCGLQVAMRVCVEGRGGAPYSTQCSAGEVRLQSCAQTQGQRLLPRRPQPPGGRRDAAAGGR